MLHLSSQFPREIIKAEEEFAKLSPKKKQPLCENFIENTFLTPPVFLPYFAFFCRHSEPHLSVRWINEDNKLVADSRDPTYQLPNRILYANGSLSVLDVKIEDTGDYICEVNIGNNRVIRQISSIEVQGERAQLSPLTVDLFLRLCLRSFPTDLTRSATETRLLIKDISTHSFSFPSQWRQRPKSFHRTSSTSQSVRFFKSHAKPKVFLIP